MDLKLYEQFLLFSLDKIKGKFLVDSLALNYGLAGAILFQLSESEVIRFENKKLIYDFKKVTEDKILEDAIELFKKSKKLRSVKYWVNKLGSKSSFYKIDLSKVDTTFSYDYGKYFFKTSGNYIEKKIDYNAYYKSKKFHNQNEYTWQEYRWDAVSGEDIGFYDKCIIKINESAEPDIVARIQKALKHYIKLMPVVKSSNEAF